MVKDKCDEASSNTQSVFEKCLKRCNFSIDFIILIKTSFNVQTETDSQENKELFTGAQL